MSLTTRIRNVQKTLQVGQTGVIDIDTCLQLEKRLAIAVSSANLVTHIKSIQRALKISDDGIIGPISMTRIETLLAEKLPATPAGASLVVSKKGVDFIISFEVSSPDTYKKLYQSPVWPRGESGVTIGIGYDCGYVSRQDFTTAWGSLLSAADLQTTLPVVGLKGVKAQQALDSCKNVTISYDKAAQVFYQHTLPAYARRVKKIYPGVEKLPPDAQAALLSLIYNRGDALGGDRRKEMAAIVPLVAKGDLKGLAAQLRGMKRLWTKASEKGLVRRREAEAVLVENATNNVLPEDYIII